MSKRFLLAQLFLATFFLGSCQSMDLGIIKTKPEQSKYALQGNRYARDGLFREAVQSYKRALVDSPHDELVNRNLGIVYVKIGDYSKAIEHLEKSLKKYDSNFEANFYLGEAHRAKNNYGKAIYRYTRALEADEKSVKALKSLSWSYFMARFYSEALTTAKSLQKLAPNDAQAAIILARTNLKLGRLPQALAMIKRAQTLTNKNNLPYLKSVEGDILFKMEKYDQAEELYRDVLKDQPLLAGALLGLGKCMIERKHNVPLALEYMERAVRLKPRMSEGLYLLGKHYENRDPEKSKKYFESFKKFAATDPEYLDEVFEVRNHPVKVAKPETPAPPPPENSNKPDQSL